MSEDITLNVTRLISILKLRTYIGGTREAFLLECEKIYNRLNSVPYWTDNNVIRLSCDVCESFPDSKKGELNGTRNR